MAKDRCDEETLYQGFRKLIEIRCELADSLGYNSYVDLGYHIQRREEYGTKELADFRSNVKKYITPVVADIKAKGIAFGYPPATAHLSNPFTGNTLEIVCQPVVDELYSLL